jgi:Peptidase A4 family
MVIRPGDLVSARLSLRGRTVDLEFRNRSTGATFAAEVIASLLENDSAEWIAEAPATCFTLDCTPLPLADFARVVFSNAQASAGRCTGRSQLPHGRRNRSRCHHAVVCGLFPRDSRGVARSLPCALWRKQIADVS